MKRGFTLVEMTVVLVVLAALTHLAVRQLSQVRDARLETVADRQLEDIRAAVYARANGESTGFLADMGRLPKATAATNATLEELWRRPEGVRAFAFRPAVSSNLCVTAAVAAELADEAVLVPTGWRGPYLHIPFGRDELLDPWGNPVVGQDAAGLARLTVSNGFVTAVSHYGAAARLRGRKTLPLAPPQGGASRLVVNLIAGTNGFATCKWYGPAAGLVTGAVEKVAFPGSVVFEGLTPGTRVFTDDVSRSVRYIDLKPGDNLLQITLP